MQQKKEYFELLKENTKIREEVEHYKTSFTTLKLTFGISAYAFLWMILLWTCESVAEAITKFIGLLIIAVPILLFSKSAASFLAQDYENSSKKGKALFIIVLIIVIPILILCLPNQGE